jgi:hypothetical protein
MKIKEYLEKKFTGEEFIKIRLGDCTEYKGKIKDMHPDILINLLPFYVYSYNKKTKMLWLTPYIMSGMEE